MYGAAVAARVGGGWWELVAALAVGVLAGGIHFGTLKSERVDLQKSFLGAFLGTLLAFGLTFVLPTFDAARALFGGITLLVPAMVVMLGSAELVGESVEAGLSRLTYGMLRFLMLGVGIAAAGTLWGLFGPLPLRTNAQALPHAVVLVIIAVGGVALTVCMSARHRDTPWIVGAVLLAWGVQELTKGGSATRVVRSSRPSSWAWPDSSTADCRGGSHRRSSCPDCSSSRRASSARGPSWRCSESRGRATTRVCSSCCSWRCSS
ncbi:threonine/serine exporter family protein [Myxococcus qinghaiensis]|uniref:threonine/serine exporter family protein n=1 Tax=Myxococcus qinghaiensis TaxID=2906758 RepID=UPI0020A7208C|nr:threonine/serine exporter family protein [Myxococcus qinghaiensis]